MITLKGRPNFFHHSGGIHRAQQRQPSPAGTTERRDQIFGINDGQLCANAVAEVPKLITTTPGAAARPRRWHSSCCRRPPPRPVCLRPNQTAAALRRNLPGPLGRSTSGGRRRRGRHQSWPPDGHQTPAASRRRTRARSIAGLHRPGGSEFKIDVVVGQHHGGGAPRLLAHAAASKELWMRVNPPGPGLQNSDSSSACWVVEVSHHNLPAAPPHRLRPEHQAVLLSRNPDRLHGQDQPLVGNVLEAICPHRPTNRGAVRRRPWAVPRSSRTWPNRGPRPCPDPNPPPPPWCPGTNINTNHQSLGHAHL